MLMPIIAAVGSFVVSERILKPKATALVVLICLALYDLFIAPPEPILLLNSELDYNVTMTHDAEFETDAEFSTANNAHYEHHIVVRSTRRQDKVKEPRALARNSQRSPLPPPIPFHCCRAERSVLLAGEAT